MTCKSVRLYQIQSEQRLQQHPWHVLALISSHDCSLFNVRGLGYHWWQHTGFGFHPLPLYLNPSRLLSPVAAGLGTWSEKCRSTAGKTVGNLTSCENIAARRDREQKDPWQKDHHHILHKHMTFVWSVQLWAVLTTFTKSDLKTTALTS